MYAAILLPGWDCTTCAAWQKKERGCTDTPIIPQEMDGETLTRCPRRPLLDEAALFDRYFELYSWYKKGYLPDVGSYLDQAAAFTQAVSIIEQAAAEANVLKEKSGKGKQINRQPTVVRNGR